MVSLSNTRRRNVAAKKLEHEAIPDDESRLVEPVVNRNIRGLLRTKSPSCIYVG